jgi:transposase InsO family protein
MNIHKNARTTPHSRALIVQRIERERWSLASAAAAAGVSERTARKWVERFRQHGTAGLVDRPSVAHRRPHALPAGWVDLIAELRRYRMTAMRIAQVLGMARSTVAAVLGRLGLSSLHRLEPPEPVVRYERQRPGELIHFDVKKLPRFEREGHRVTGNRTVSTQGAGLDFIHVAIDDYSRLAYVEVLADERKANTTGFLIRALRWFRSHGIQVAQVMSDNGVGYVSRLFARACRWLQLRHIRTRPYTPKTNGKAERFIQTLLREWAYLQAYPNSDARNAVLPAWLRQYNELRPHASLNQLPPVSRIPSYREQRS